MDVCALPSIRSLLTRLHDCSIPCNATATCERSNSPQRLASKPGRCAPTSAWRASMRSSILLVAGGTLLALAVVVAVVVEAPATLLDSRVDLLSGGRVRVANAKGTVWRGSGELTLLPTSADERRMPISWRVKPLPLFWGDIAGTLNGDDLTATPASFSFSRSRTSLQNFVVALPAAALLRVANIPSMLSASGNLEFNVDSVSMTEQAIDAAYRRTLAGCRSCCAAAGADYAGRRSTRPCGTRRSAAGESVQCGRRSRLERNDHLCQRRATTPR